MCGSFWKFVQEEHVLLEVTVLPKPWPRSIHHFGLVWGFKFLLLGCFVCFSFLFCPNIFLYSPPLDIDQLKLILRLVGTPGAELLKKISSESVSCCLDCNYLPCWEPLPLPFCQSVLWPGYVCKHMCPLCADSRMRCVCVRVPACSHAWVCFVFSLGIVLEHGSLCWTVVSQ